MGVSQKDIAQKAGVTIATVSMALRNHPSIPVATRERIQKLSKKLGYKKNPYLNILMQNRRKREGVLPVVDIAYINFFHKSALTRKDGLSPNIRLFYEGAKSKAEESGFKLSLFTVDEKGMNISAINRILKARNVRGLVLGPAEVEDTIVSFDWEHFTSIVIGASLPELELNRVIPDYAQSMALAIETLRSRGYRKIGYVSNRAIEKKTNYGWLARYMVYQSEINESERIPVLSSSYIKAIPIHKWIKTHRPEVIMSTDPRTYDLLVERKTHKGIDFLELNHINLRHPVAAINQHSFRIGEVAVDRLTAQLYRNEYGLPPYTQTMTIKSSWEEGETIRRK